MAPRSESTTADLVATAADGAPVLSGRRIFAFWLPLGAMWALMAVENPLIAAFIARLPDAKLNLASYGVTSSVGMILESPIIVLLTAGTALARGLASYRRLLGFMHVMAAVLTGLHLLVGLTGLYPLVLGRVIGAPAEIVEGSRRTFLLMAPWAAAVGYRRLWQGVLIGHGRTAVVPLAMVVRIVSIVGAMVLADALPTGLSGAEAGALALSVGLVASAAVAGVSARAAVIGPLLRRARAGAPAADSLPWRTFFSFYVPLSLTSVIGLLIQPTMTLGVSRAVAPLESLAVWPVASGLVFLFRGTAFSLQEATVSLLKDWRQRRPVGSFVAAVAAVLGAGYALLALTPLRELWFVKVAGLAPELAGYAVAPALVMLAAPPLACLAAYSTGVLVVRRRPAAVTLGVALNFATLVAGIVLLNVLLPMQGALLAAICLAAAYLVQSVYLWTVARRVIREADAG